MQSTSLLYGKAMRQSSRNVFEALMIANIAIIQVHSECKYCTQMHFLIDQRMSVELQDKLHNDSNVKKYAVPEVYSDRMRSQCKDHKVCSFLAAYPSPTVLRRSYVGQLTDILAIPFLAKYSSSDVTQITSTTRCNAWLPQSVTCRTTALMASASYYQGTSRSPMQHLEPCRYFRQKLSRYGNTAPNVVLLHRVICIKDVCGPAASSRNGAPSCGAIMREVQQS